MRHVVWDWNGTLFDDISIIVQATNAVGASRGWPVFDISMYREEFQRPLRGFYDKVHGRAMSDDEYRRTEDDWHDAYFELISHASPNADTQQALLAVRDLGATQSILSMWMHDLLNELVETLGMTKHFTRVDGYSGGGLHKYEHLAAHLEALELGAGHDIVYIGDSVDDVLAAQECGIGVVAVCTGSQHPAHFDDLDVAVANTLTEAVSIAVTMSRAR